MLHKAPPVFLLVFANDQQDKTRYLRKLPEEIRALQSALEPAERAGLCVVKVLTNATIDEVFNTLQDDRYRDRIAVFHYGGHAGSFELFLEADKKRNATLGSEGLVTMLSHQLGLQFVFLNGCSTEMQARQLTDAGIPAVIGTFESINDEVATLIASRFYKGIGSGINIGRAWKEAGAEIQGEYKGNIRGLVVKDAPADQLPWNLQLRNGSEIVLEWNLPDAVDNPLYALPPLPPSFDLPETPFRLLDRYKKQDAPVFFGRASYVRQLYQRLTNPQGSPVVMLCGQSGVGKSSLLEAGVLPRLEQVSQVMYLRRSEDLGLTGTLAQGLGLKSGKDEISAAAVLDAWFQREANTQPGLTIILDQLEEVFTRPIADNPNELPDFAAILQAVFADPTRRPKGKLLLSFRKEYEPEVNDLLKRFQIPREEIFLKRLEKKEIIEIVKGLTSTPLLQQKYRLQIEEGLPESIAIELLADADSPVAPVLQIILTKLWQTQESKEERWFREADFLELKEKGIFLGDFFRQQMEQLKTWEEKLKNRTESSGLALDILNYHTTDLGTSESHTLQELQTQYQHRADVLDALIKVFKDLYLLTDAGEGRTALAHDTLAPVVHKEIKNSDKPGQKALRILAGKLANFQRSANQVFIDEEDLKLVEDGKDGMRIWVDEEAALIAKSRERRKLLEAERYKQKRFRRIAYALIAILALVAAGLGFRYWQHSFVGKYIAQARLEAATDPTQAMQTLQKAFAISKMDPEALQAAAAIYSENEFYEKIYPHGAAVKGICFSPDVQFLYTFTENTLYKWSREGEQIRTWQSESPLTAMKLSPDGQWIMTGNQNGDLCKINAGNLQQEQKLNKLHQATVTQLLFSPDGQFLFSAGKDSTLQILQFPALAQHQAPLRFTDEDGETISALAYVPSSHDFMIGFPSGHVQMRRWDEQGTLLKSFSRHEDQVLSIAISPADTQIVTGGRDALLNLWNTNGDLRLSVKAHDSRIEQVLYSPDTSRIFSASTDHTIKCWSPKGDLITVYKGHTGPVGAIAISADGRYLATAGEKRVLLWPVESKVVKRFGKHPDGVSTIEMSKDGHWVVTAGDAGQSVMGERLNDRDFDIEKLLGRIYNSEKFPRDAYLWDATTQKPIAVFTGHRGGVNAASLSPIDNTVLTAGDDTVAIVWNKNGQKALTLAPGHTNKVLDAVFSPDGEWMLTGGYDNQAILWDRQGKLKVAIPHRSVVAAVAFSPNSKNLLTGCYDGVARLFDLSGKLIHAYSDLDSNRINAVAFSPDGKSILTGENINVAHLYRLSGEIMNAFEISTENRTGGRAINTVAFSPDGMFVCLGGEGGLAQVFMLRKEEPVKMETLVHYPKRSIQAVAFSPDGKYILTGSADGWGRMWRWR